MISSYSQEDVTILLKDITGMVMPKSAEERERLIQNGKHYSEMLPIEYSPSDKYMQAYKEALNIYSHQTANAVACVAEKIIDSKGKNVVIVSLARAGIPIGILIKRYILKKYNINAPHYAISIIRGRGIDKNAVNFILKKHNANAIQFVDGWIGKGAILNELKKDLEEFEGISSELAVVSDPAGITNLCGTHEDILIPSSCLNCTVSGLISRTFLRDDIIKSDDFHGAVYYKELEKYDLSENFLSAIENEFDFCDKNKILKQPSVKGIDEVKSISKKFGISDINLIKPGIGEATRVLLRRIPWKILINKSDIENPMLKHMVHLAEEKGVVVESYNFINYKACGIIKKITDI